MTTNEYQRRTEVVGDPLNIGDPVTIESNYQGQPIDHPATVVEIDEFGNIFVDIDHGDGITQKRMRV